MSSAPSLSSRHADLTQAVILDAAVAQVERAPLSELSVRGVARLASVSERTVFRYFASREDLLDALAAEVRRRLSTPPVPTDLSALLEYPAGLYGSFEARSELTRAALDSELFYRLREGARERAAAVRAVIDALAPRRPAAERRLATATISYQLVATSWSYYRHHFGLTLEESIDCARQVIRHSLGGLGVAAAVRRRR